MLNITVNHSRNSTSQKEWQDNIKKNSEREKSSKILGKDLIKIDGEIKSFSDKQILREFSTTNPFYKKYLKGTHMV